MKANLDNLLKGHFKGTARMAPQVVPRDCEHMAKVLKAETGLSSGIDFGALQRAA